jgi:Zn-finger protein
MHTYIRLESQAGARIENAIAEARDHARRLGIEVKLCFNDAWVHIKATDSRAITEILDEYNQLVDKMAAAASNRSRKRP